MRKALATRQVTNGTVQSHLEKNRSQGKLEGKGRFYSRVRLRHQGSLGSRLPQRYPEIKHMK